MNSIPLQYIVFDGWFFFRIRHFIARVVPFDTAEYTIIIMFAPHLDKQMLYTYSHIPFTQQWLKRIIAFIAFECECMYATSRSVIKCEIKELTWLGLFVLNDFMLIFSALYFMCCFAHDYCGFTQNSKQTEYACAYVVCSKNNDQLHFMCISFVILHMWFNVYVNAFSLNTITDKVWRKILILTQPPNTHQICLRLWWRMVLSTIINKSKHEYECESRQLYSNSNRDFNKQ